MLDGGVIEEAVRLVCGCGIAGRWTVARVRSERGLLAEHRNWPVPSERTLHTHFKKRGLVKKRKRRRKSAHPGAPTTRFDAPNSVWTADSRGDSKTRDGWRCYPLTIHDGFSTKRQSGVGRIPEWSHQT